jgi:hypothetical protein
MRTGAVHINLRKHRKRYFVLKGAKFLDLTLGLGLLGAKLIAGEPQHNQATALVFIVERLKLSVLARENTLACYIYNQQNRALIQLKRNCGPVNRSSCDVVKGYWDSICLQDEPQVIC